MTRENAKQLLPIIQAYAEGKEIEFQTSDGKWSPIRTASFDYPPDTYRIAPEKPAPPLWSSPEHVPLGAWIRGKDGEPRWALIVASYACGIRAGINMDLQYLNLDRYEHSTDQGKTWKPCTVAEGSV